MLRSKVNKPHHAMRPAPTADGPERTIQNAASPPGSDREDRIREHCEDQNFADAVRLILDAYGDEVRAFINARTRSRTSMEDVFSSFSEDVWKGLPRYRFEGKVRSWVYTVARHALFRYSKSRKRWGSRHVASASDESEGEARLSMDSRFADVIRLQQAIARLEPSERRLLEQRLVLSKAWREIAAECQGADCSTESLERESARLRKRYQVLLARLRAQHAGRLGDV